MLLPAESMALTVAWAQVERGESPTPNISAVVVMALARLAHAVPVPWCVEHNASWIDTLDGCGHDQEVERCRLEEPPQVYRIEAT